MVVKADSPAFRFWVAIKPKPWMLLDGPILTLHVLKTVGPEEDDDDDDESFCKIAFNSSSRMVLVGSILLLFSFTMSLLSNNRRGPDRCCCILCHVVVMVTSALGANAKTADGRILRGANQRQQQIIAVKYVLYDWWFSKSQLVNKQTNLDSCLCVRKLLKASSQVSRLNHWSRRLQTQIVKVERLKNHQFIEKRFFKTIVHLDAAPSHFLSPAPF